ncbi:MAG: hypothetical protein ACPGO3_11800 [Magnetospiraceae bacterium]
MDVRRLAGLCDRHGQKARAALFRETAAELETLPCPHDHDGLT